MDVVLLSFLVATIHGATVFHHWTLTNEDISPDGFMRSAALVNSVFPGPLLTAIKGDLITINVKNSLFDPTMRRCTSIVCGYLLLKVHSQTILQHWHGIVCHIESLPYF